MREIENHPDIELIPIDISNNIDNHFDNIIKLDIVSTNTDPRDISQSMSEVISYMGFIFEKNKIDLLLLLGDRHEVLAAAIASIPFCIPIAHLGGGEITEGAIDNVIRHCLTKLSHLHYPITSECAERIKNLG